MLRALHCWFELGKSNYVIYYQMESKLALLMEYRQPPIRVSGRDLAQQNDCRSNRTALNMLRATNHVSKTML